MENKKDIGKAFREKLDALEQSPSDGLWRAIAADLDQKKKRRLLPFWIALFTAMVLGVTALVFSGKTVTTTEGFSDPGTGTVHSGTNNNSRSDTRNADAGSGSGSDNNTITDNGQAENDDLTNPTTHRDASKTSRKDGSKNQGVAVQNDKSSNAKPHTGYFSGEKDSQASDKQKPASGKDIGGNGNSIDSKRSKQSRANLTKAQRQLADAKQTKTRKNRKQFTDEKQMAVGSNPSDGIQTEEKTVDAMANTNPAKNGSPENERPKDGVTDSLKTNVTPKIEPTTPGATLPEKTQKDSAATKNNALQKLSLFVYASPTFGGHVSNKSPYDPKLNDNEREFKPTLSYGAYAIYQATDSWSLRFGISIMNLQMVTRDAVVNTINYSYIDYTKNTNVSIYAQSGNAKSMDIIQEISYTEVPLELKYAISRRRFGINAYGGISAMFLGKNVVAGKTPDGKRYEMGKTANLSSNSYTIGAGIGLDYKFTKYVRLNVEPIFKYHLLDYKNVGIRPYSFGVMTGLQFSL
jgi:hypothetical protein